MTDALFENRPKDADLWRFYCLIFLCPVMLTIVHNTLDGTFLYVNFYNVK